MNELTQDFTTGGIFEATSEFSFVSSKISLQEIHRIQKIACSFKEKHTITMKKKSPRFLFLYTSSI